MQDTDRKVKFQSVTTTVSETSETLEATPAASLLRRLKEINQDHELREQWMHVYQQRQLLEHQYVDAKLALPTERLKKVEALEQKRRENSRRFVCKFFYLTGLNQENYQGKSRVKAKKLKALDNFLTKTGRENKKISEEIEQLFRFSYNREITKELHIYIGQHPKLKELLEELQAFVKALPNNTRAAKLLQELIIPSQDSLGPKNQQAQTFRTQLAMLQAELRKPALAPVFVLTPFEKTREALADFGSTLRYTLIDRTPVTSAGMRPAEIRQNGSMITTEATTSNSTLEDLNTMVGLALQQTKTGATAVIKSGWRNVIKPTGQFLLSGLKRVVGLESPASVNVLTQVTAVDTHYFNFIKDVHHLIEQGSRLLERATVDHAKSEVLSPEQKMRITQYLDHVIRLKQTFIANPALKAKVDSNAVEQQALIQLEMIVNKMLTYSREHAVSHADTAKTQVTQTSTFRMKH